MATGMKSPITIRIDADIVEKAKMFQELGLLNMSDAIEAALAREVETLKEFEAEVKALRDKVAKARMAPATNDVHPVRARR